MKYVCEMRQNDSGQWRHQAAIIYVSAGTGCTEDDRLVGWAGGHEEAEKICVAHNQEIEKLKTKQ